jgi:hypothetical protein
MIKTKSGIELMDNKALDDTWECEECEESIPNGGVFYTSVPEAGMDYIDCYCVKCVIIE